MKVGDVVDVHNPRCVEPEVRTALPRAAAGPVDAESSNCAVAFASGGSISRRHAAARRFPAVTWRHAAIWPTSVQLGGNAHEHRQAAEAVRAALTGPLLSRLTLRERVSTLRAAVATAQGISALQSATITRLARQGGLWVAREREDLRPPGVQRRHIKLEWEAMAPGHPAGRLLVDQASIAQQALAAAGAAVDRSVLPGAPLKGDAGEITMLDHRVVADWWESFEPTVRTRRPEDEAAARSPHPSIDRRVGH